MELRTFLMASFAVVLVLACYSVTQLESQGALWSQLYPSARSDAGDESELLPSSGAFPQPILIANTSSAPAAPALANLSANFTPPSSDQNATRARERQIEEALSKIRAARSGAAKGLFALTRPCGQTCNNYLSLALGVTQARLHNARFLLWGRWKEIIIQFDVDRLAAMIGDDLQVDDAGESDRVPKASCSETVWCASRLSLDIIRDVLRPPAKDRVLGLAALAKLRESGATTLVSVHGRFIRGNCLTQGQRLAYFCHEKDLVDGKLESSWDFHYCAYGLSPALANTVRRTWPERDWGREKLGFFLSSDGFQSKIDSTYNSSLPMPPGVVEAFKPTGTSMPADMWWVGALACSLTALARVCAVACRASVFADYYVSTPLSSCEGIIAQWRNVLNNRTTSNGVWPTECYKSYKEPQRREGFCEHTNVVIIDDPGPHMSLCDKLLVLGTAIIKARNGGLLLWGPWRHLVETYLDVGHLRRAFAHVEFSMQDVFRTHSRYESHPGNWYSVRLNATKELGCARRKTLRALRDGFRPNAQVQQEASAALAAWTGRQVWLQRREDVANASLLHGSCAAAAAIAGAPLPALLVNTSSAGQLWASVHQPGLLGTGQPMTSCAQVVATWRAAMNTAELSPEACFVRMVNDSDDATILTTGRPSRGMWWDDWLCSAT
jgi:hypothetical protein